MHNGVSPSPATINLAVSDAATFMATTTQLVWNVAYEDVSMVDVVTQPDVRAEQLSAAQGSSGPDEPVPP